MPFSPNITCCYLYPITKYGYPPPAQDTLKHIEEMKNLGFQSIELEGIRETHLLQIYDQRFAIKEKLDRWQLQVPYFCAVLPGLGSADAEVREKQLDLFRTGCEIAQIFGAKGILDNGPLPPYIFPEDIPVVRHYETDVLKLATLPENLDWKTYWQNLVKTFQKACDIAAEYHLTYQIHPATGVLASTDDGFLLFASEVNRSNLRFNFDVANLFVMQSNLDLSLQRLLPYIDYIHISDNGGQHTEHLAIGEGKIPFEQVFKRLREYGFQGDFGIDIGGAESGVENLDEAYVNAARWLENFL